MNSTFIELKKHHNKINIVDIGAARAAFLFELSKVFELSNVFSVGIDPLNHGISNQYSKFLNVCVDNIPRKTEETKTFYVNSIDQASSLCILTADNLSSEKKECKVYYTEDIIKKLTTIVDTIDVKVLNLSDIIDDEVEDNNGTQMSDVVFINKREL